MREILFRAKVKDTDEWVEGYYAMMGKENLIRHYIVQNCALTGLFDDPEENMYFNDVEIDPETCKYTGGSCCWPIDQCAECLNHGCKWLQDCVCCNAYCDAVADFVSAEYCEKCKFYEEEK